MERVSEGVERTVERVDRATLPELRDVAIDDVYVQMDRLLESRPTPMDLYRRWEDQHWRTQDLDLSEDAAQWRDMSGGLLEAIRVELQRTFTLFFVGEQAVTDTLSPLVHAAPDEPARVFLSTQLADEARHAVFFARFFEEVVGLDGGLSAALAAVKDQTVAGFMKIFDEDLVAATEAVRRDPHDYGAWVEAVTVYHLVVEGMLALTGQKYVLQVIREMGILPGFYTGFTAVARDESRHVAFGVRALMEAGARDPALLHRVERVVDRLLEPACRVVAAPDRRFAVRIEETPPPLRINPYDVASFSLRSLTKRLRLAGVGAAACADIERRGSAYYEAAWEEYERLHGEEHPRRYFDRRSVVPST